MDILCSFFSIFLILFSFIMVVVAVDGKTSVDKSMRVPAFIFATFSVWLFIWPILANNARRADTNNLQVTYHPIEIRNDTPYYFNEKGTPVALTGDSRFVDVNKFQVKITNILGGWTMCMCVTDGRFTELVPKQPER